jgi:metallo-beta-lactamase class B
MRKILLPLLILVGFASSAQISKHKISEDIYLYHIKDSIFVHLTYETSEQFGRFSSNGLIFIKNGESIMIDTPMDNTRTEIIHNYLKEKMNVTLSKLIIGHFHDDCLGGLEYIHNQGIESIASKLTVDKCNELHLPIPSKSFTDSLIFDFHGEKVVCRYLGGGHTIDNITVWFPNRQVLFGGCLIRSMQTQNLGNLADAVVDQWAATVKKVIDKSPNVQHVIPGHGNWGGKELLLHTINLVEKHLAD